MKTFYVAAFVLSLAVVPAFGAGLKAVDIDNDGTISLDEAKAAALAKFDQRDTDHDNTLDKKEAKGFGLKKIDTDSDGTVDKAEFGAAVEQLFKAVDTDNDGTIDAKELKTSAGKHLSKLL